MKVSRLFAVLAVMVGVLALPSVAGAADRDRDRMPDSWEKRFGLNTKKNDARRDRDRDGLRNLEEYRAGTSPRSRDSDGDGRRDDRERAGRVQSFDSATGELTITLFGGGSITGIVNSSTELKCDDEDDSPSTGGGGATGDTRGDGTPEDNKVLARHSSDDDDDDDDDRSGRGRGGDDDDDDRGDEDDRRGGDRDRTCPSGALKPGAIVKEADVTGNGTQTIFDEIELAV